jgi:anti-sigma regulatory factor (Ser/Thr protein kinase)
VSGPLEEARQERMDIVETQLPSSLSSPQLARAFLRSTLETWNLDGFGDITELLVTELVANVVTHVGAPMTLRVRRASSAMRVEIDDPSTDVPVVRHPAAADEHGRGMLLVDELATAWGVEPRAEGKTVWFELDVSTATAEAQPVGG